MTPRGETYWRLSLHAWYGSNLCRSLICRICPTPCRAFHQPPCFLFRFISHAPLAAEEYGRNGASIKGVCQCCGASAAQMAVQDSVVPDVEAVTPTSVPKVRIRGTPTHRLNPDTVWGKVIRPLVPRKGQEVRRDRLPTGMEAMWE